MVDYPIDITSVVRLLDKEGAQQSSALIQELEKSRKLSDHCKSRIGDFVYRLRCLFVDWFLH